MIEVNLANIPSTISHVIHATKLSLRDNQDPPEGAYAVDEPSINKNRSITRHQQQTRTNTTYTPSVS